MALLLRYRMTWSGAPGLPGFTTLYAALGTPGQAFADQAMEFLRDVLSPASPGSALPDAISIKGDPVVDVINDADGGLDSSLPVVPPATIEGDSAGPYPQPAGAAVTWTTNGIVLGRRVRGRTFLVPLAGNQYEGDGTLGAAFLANAVVAVDTYLSGAADPVVWSRPRGVPPTGGSSHTIIGGRVSDKAAILSSRRD